MDRKLRVAFAVSALALTLASVPAHAGTGRLEQAGRGFLSGLWSRLVAVFNPFDAFNEQDGEDPATREGDPQTRGYIDPNGTDASDSRG